MLSEYSRTVRILFVAVWLCIVVAVLIGVVYVVRGREVVPLSATPMVTPASGQLSAIDLMTGMIQQPAPGGCGDVVFVLKPTEYTVHDLNPVFFASVEWIRPDRGVCRRAVVWVYSSEEQALPMWVSQVRRLDMEATGEQGATLKKTFCVPGSKVRRCSSTLVSQVGRMVVLVETFAPYVEDAEKSLNDWYLGFLDSLETNPVGE